MGRSVVGLMIWGVLMVLMSASSAQAAAPNCEEVRAKYQCPVEKKKVTLSFDDGVADVTPKVLDVLKRENIQGTFFVLGNKVDCSLYTNDCKTNPDSAQCQSFQLCQQRRQTLARIKSEGHMIGSHSYQHDRHSTIPLPVAEFYIKRSRDILAPFFTTEPAIFRLPHGDGWFNQKDKPAVMAALKANGFEHIGWEMTAYDWNKDYQTGDKILDNVMTQMCGGKGRQGVILFHDGVFENEHVGRTFTADNLARWIPSMRCAADFVPLTHFKKTLQVK
jgi:peptidoglycan/xylan/chitin deacetylase (PgdA/CDA1 family)